MVVSNLNNLKIVIWNAQSISRKLVEFYNFLSKFDVDIITVSETWLKPDVKLLSHCNYSCYRLDRMTAAHGGVAIFIKRNIKHQLVKQIRTKIIEVIGIEVECGNNQVITILSAYYLGSNTAVSLKGFRNDIRALTNKVQPYILCGDLNAKDRF